MRGNKKAGLVFTLGTFDEKKFKGNPTARCFKKSQVERRANLILQKYGHCWLRVKYRKGEYNDGVYKTMEDLKDAMALFIEQSLLNYLEK